MAYSDSPFDAVDGMIDRFGMGETCQSRDGVDYRIRLFEEETTETLQAYRDCDAEGVVDGHIDIIVIALGNLSLLGVDARKAFDAVMEANMNKVAGKRDETDPGGASIMKPDGWVGPDHSDNHGVLDELFKREPED